VPEESEISKRIDDLHRRFDDLRTYLDRRLEDLRSDVAGHLELISQRLDEQARRLDEQARRLDALIAFQHSALRWTITTMVALFGIAVPVWMWVLSLVLRPLLR